MARGELIKKLMASRDRDDEFRAVAEEIIKEEEKKNNRVLARSLRATLNEGSSKPARPKALAPLIPFPDAAGEYVELIEPRRNAHDIILTAQNTGVLSGLIREFRDGERIRRAGLPLRQKVLFCGPPGSGKTLAAELFAAEVGLPLYVVKIDTLISSYLGETASNLRKLFEFVRKRPCVLFFDEFDALARAREDASEHNELRRVVNSLLLFVDRIEQKGFLLAATNLTDTLDPAIWRRFDEVIWFENPDRTAICRFLDMRFRNLKAGFETDKFAGELEGYSFAALERITMDAMRRSIIAKRKTVTVADFRTAIREEARRRGPKDVAPAGSVEEQHTP